MGKTVYFFGAGATKAIAPEAPVNKDLVKKALEDFSASPEATSLKSLIDRLFVQRKEPFIDNQIWNLLDYIIQEDKSPCKEYNLEEIIELRKCLLNLIVREFKKSLESVTSNLFENFIMKIEQESAFITTNYDILIDIALNNVTHTLNYGAKTRQSVMEGVSNKKGMERAWSSAFPAINIGSIPLLKIHGSLSWLYCPKCDEVDITGSKEGVIKALSGYYCFNELCTCKYEPLLITPTMFKNYNNRFIKEVWDYAEKELINAENLVFVGYALKDEDYQIRCLLMKALLNRKERYKRITVIEKETGSPEEKKQPDENIKQKYEDLYGEVDFQPIGFKEYVDRLQKFRP